MLRQVTVIFTLWLVLVSSYLHPKTRPPHQTKRANLVLPAEFMAQGFHLQPELRIPNAKFCKDRQLEPYRNYMVLPWWHNYCDRYMEKEERHIKEKKLYLPLYGHVLKMLKEYKKSMARK